MRDLGMGARLHLHLDPLGGAAGDMFVAALLDAFPHLTARVMADCAAVLPAEAGLARLDTGMSGGMAVKRFGLDTGASDAGAQDHPHGHDHAQAEAHGHGHTHDHGHEHGHGHDGAHHPHHAHGPAEGHDHGHSHAHAHAHAHGHSHSHSHHHSHDTTYRALRARIEEAPLAPGTAAEACAILHRIALAEAAAHDLPVEEVHFHELADWDSLMDVTAAGSIAAALEGATWSVAPLPLGAGLVKTAHGMLPVPAPATAKILEGYDWIDDGVAGERVTPTGAAIIAHLTAGAHGSRPPGRLTTSGMGAGTRTLPDRPNVLRVTAFETTAPAITVPGSTGGPDSDRVVQLACDLDDMTGEEIGWAVEALRALPGVVDLTLLQAQGKKSRPVTRMEVLLSPRAEADVSREIFDRTSTLGLRRTEVTRLILPRDAGVAPDGARRKTAPRPSGATTKAESDDLATASTLAERRRRARDAET